MDFPQEIFSEIVSFVPEEKRSQVKKTLEIGTYFVNVRHRHFTGDDSVSVIEIREVIRIEVRKRSKCFVWFSLHRTNRKCPFNSLNFPEGKIKKQRIQQDDDGFECVPLNHGDWTDLIESSERSRVHFARGHPMTPIALPSRIQIHPIYRRDAEFTPKTWKKHLEKHSWERQLARILKGNPLPRGWRAAIPAEPHRPIGEWIQDLEETVQHLKNGGRCLANTKHFPDWETLQFELFEKIIELWRSWE